MRRKISESVLLSVLYFNPRTHKECDLKGYIMEDQMQEFQSTHSQGVRPFHAGAKLGG